MSFRIDKIFPVSKNILEKNQQTYLVLNTLILIVTIGYLLTIPFYFFSGYPTLTIYSVVNTLFWVFIWGLNRNGKHLLSTIIICIAIYQYAVILMLHLGWDAGFQYHLMAEMTLLLLYPSKKLKISIIVTALMLLSFLILYFLLLNIDTPKTPFIVFLHTFNAIISILALAATTLFFRTNTVQLINKLHYTSSTDPLTGLFNRRRMNIELTQHCKMVKRYDQSNSLILLDIDYFKKINDQYGHAGGDEVLKQFSKLIKEGLRDADIISRWGGEEFLVLTPSTDVKNAAIVAEKLRKMVETNAFKVAGQEAHITITCGVTELCTNHQIEDALKQVDKLLYEGKNKGRNRVAVQKLEAKFD